MEEILFTGDVVVKRGLLDLQRGGDLASGGRGVAFLPEEQGGGVQQAIYGGSSAPRFSWVVARVRLAVDSLSIRVVKLLIMAVRDGRQTAKISGLDG